MDGKKVVGALIVVFVVFWLFTDPRSLADTTEGAGALAGDFFTRVIDFLGSLGS